MAKTKASEIPEDEIRDVVALVREHGGIRAASRATGKPFGWVQLRFSKARQRGWLADYPEFDLTHPVAPGMTSRGTSIRYNEAGEVEQFWNKTKQAGRDPEEVIQLPDAKTIVKLSTLYDQEGNVTQQWVAEKPDAKAQVEAWHMFAKELCAGIEPIEPIAVNPAALQGNLCAVYPISDHHIGMMAWGEETRGGNYDMKIAERMLAGAMDFLVDSSPPCGRAVVLFKGDFMHWDGHESVTPTSGHNVDTDTRYQKMARVAMKCIHYCVKKAAEKHGEVYVLIQIGNHDISSMGIMKESVAMYYENNPRIHVDTHPGHFLYHQFGKNLIGSHHGHGRAAKFAQLPLIMATDVPEMWGTTTHRVVFVGHFHCDKVEEFPGCRVEQLQILAPPDAYAANNGYRSGRSMKAIILHEELGETVRILFKPEMLEATL